MASMKKARQPLTRERIVEAAMKLVDQEGVEGLSMRKLGACLKVEAMTLYHHVANKDALLDLLVERLVIEAATAPETRSGDWRKKLEGFTRRFYAALMSCPRVVPLLAMRPVRSPEAMSLFVGAIEGLRGEGFTPAEAYYTLNSLALLAISHALAATGHQAPKADKADLVAEAAYYEALSKMFKSAQSFAGQHQKLFDFALTAFLDGLAAQRAMRA